MITVKKLKLTIINENEEVRKEQYKFIRDSQYAQYQGLNSCMAYLVTGYYLANRDIKSEEFKAHQKTITNSMPILEGIEFGKGIDSKSAITQKVKKDFSIALKNGLAKGERGATNYKRTFPLMTRGRDLKFNYEDKGKTILIKWVNKIVFEVVTGNKVNEELLHTLNKVINKEYKVMQSSLEFDRNNKLILNLTLDIPIKVENEVIEGRTLGVDLGLKVPAYASLSDQFYIRQGFGDYNEFVKVRMQFKARRERLYKQLQLAKGGKGRKDKLSAMTQLRDKESKFAQTYNHQLSCKLVKFAKDNKCEFINMEKLTKGGFDNSVLGRWSYYQLQSYIEYKAERENIKVRYVDPAYTSQTCSRCGHIDKESRQTQEKFECTKCGHTMNADYNASLNIARSTKFVK